MVGSNLLQRGIFTALAIVSVGTLALSVTSPLMAQDAEVTQEEIVNGNSTLKVSPVRTDLRMDPGETRTVSIIVTNPTDEDINVRPVQNDFIADGEDGDPAIILDETEYAPKHSLKRFMAPLENLVVPANESVTLEVELVVPTDAEAGGYFGAVRFEAVDSTDGGQVNLNTSIASLILLRVNGDVPERLLLTDFEVRQGEKTGSWFTDDQDLSAFVRFENDGGVQLSPIGKISIMRGDDIAYEADFNDKDQLDMILPDSARRWSIPVSELGGFGQYTATATFTFGSKNETVEVSTSFWVIPWAVIIAGLVGVLVLIAVIVGIVFYIRNRGTKKKTPRGRR